MSLNPADPRPLYHQLAAILREQITRHDLPPGGQMPTEAELAEAHHASRNTVRLALGLLRAEGLVTSRQGSGNFVRSAPAMKYYASSTGSRRERLAADRRYDTFTQQIESQGKTAHQISTVEVVPASEEIATALLLTPQEPVAVRRRVMYADAEPLQLGDSYYPLSVVADSKIMDPADVPEGTDQVLDDLGHAPARYEDQITWRMPTVEEATQLHLHPGVPVGRLVRTTFDHGDEPVEVYVVILPGDRHVLLYELSAD